MLCGGLRCVLRRSCFRCSDVPFLILDKETHISRCLDIRELWAGPQTRSHIHPSRHPGRPRKLSTSEFVARPRSSTINKSRLHRMRSSAYYKAPTCTFAHRNLAPCACKTLAASAPHHPSLAGMLAGGCLHCLRRLPVTAHAMSKREGRQHGSRHPASFKLPPWNSVARFGAESAWASCAEQHAAWEEFRVIKLG